MGFLRFISLFLLSVLPVAQADEAFMQFYEELEAVTEEATTEAPAEVLSAPTGSKPSLQGCSESREGCPFLIIGHRGAPFEEAENTIPAFREAMRQGANALEIDLVMTKDKKVVVFHDRDPNELIAVIRQAGLEGQKYIPFNPDLDKKNRKTVEEMTLAELRRDYGYALSKGILGDTFTQNEKDPHAVIPSIDDFTQWANKEDKLQAVFLDIKLVPGQEKLAREMAEEFARAFADSPYEVYMMTPYDSIYAELEKWGLENPDAKNSSVILDHEGGGVLGRVKDLKKNRKAKVSSLSVGKTPFINWNDYGQEVNEVMNTGRTSKGLFPIITWTVDDERKLYQLLQLGVDGVITNKPAALTRLVNRHWQDHAMVAKTLAACHDSAKNEGPWQVCTTGARLDPFGPIGEEEVRRWVCEENGIHKELKDLYGCGGIFDKVNVGFKGKIESDPRLIVYTTSKGVETTRLPAVPDEKTKVVFMNYKQEKCSDGVLNHRCEYEFETEYFADGKWQKLGEKSIQKDGFHQVTLVPKNAQKLRLHLRELDDGKVEDQKTVELELDGSGKTKIKSPKGTFEGSFEVFARPGEKVANTDDTQKAVALEFFEAKCNAGPFRFKGDYRLKLSALLPDGSERALPFNNKKLKGPFVVYTKLPDDAKAIKAVLTKMNGDKIENEWERFIAPQHGTTAVTDAGALKLKFFDYDEHREHSEGVEGFKPHQKSPTSPSRSPGPN